MEGGKELGEKAMFCTCLFGNVGSKIFSRAGGVAGSNWLKVKFQLRFMGRFTDAEILEVLQHISIVKISFYFQNIHPDTFNPYTATKILDVM